MFNDAMQRALAQARDLQKQIAVAATEAADQMKPHVARSIENAKAIQETLAAHAAGSAGVASKNADGARAHLSDYIAMGNEALKESAALTKETALKMIDQSKKIVDDVSAAMAKGRE